MRAPADELFERWKELYEYLENLGAELGISGVRVVGDHNGTPYVGVFCPEARAKVFADAVHSHLASNVRYAEFKICVHGLDLDYVETLTFTVTSEATSQ